MLIVGIVPGVLRRLGRARRSRIVWAGVLAAIVVSVVVGLTLHAPGVALEERSEEIFEGAAMLLATGVLTWMTFPETAAYAGRVIRLRDGGIALP